MGMPSSSSTCGCVRGGREVLPDLDVTVPRGQVVGLLGPSGGGKSTLMRAIVGVQVRSRRARSPCSARRPGRPGCGTGSATSPRRPASTATSRCATTSRYFAAGHRRAGSDAVDRAIAAVDLADHADARVEQPLGRAAVAGLSSPCALVGRPRGARARRADRRARPGAAARAVGPVPPAGRARVARCSSRATSWTRRRGATGCSCCARARILSDSHPARAARAHRHRRRRAGLPRPHRRGGRGRRCGRHRRGCGGMNVRHHPAPPRRGSCASCAPTTAPSP